ncbi:MAG: YraN family protein [Deltaproteobacteria bacterium]|nr:YraN family protein [Deltaproteobacteria bacterium]
MEARMKLGMDSEGLVAREMTRRGYDIVHRNYRTRYGELDIVARRGSEMVVVEVRSRNNDLGYEALESVQHGKREKVRRTTEIYLSYRPIDYDEVRFFVATVNWVDGSPSIAIIEDAF